MTTNEHKGEARDLSELLLEHRDELVRFLAREGGGLLRFEAAEDLAQGVHLRVLEGAAEFEYRGRRRFLAYLHTIARRYIADRHDYWSAMKRGSGRVLRLSFSTTGGGSRIGGAHGLAGALTGPSTFASRRELLVLAARALAVLPERDRKLVQWASDGVPLDEQGVRLGLGYAAVQRAGRRALDRFQKAFDLIAGP